jgi:hypothetical protein
MTCFDPHCKSHQENVMVRRELLGALTITAAGLVGAIGRVARADNVDRLDDVHETCLANCQTCKRECDEVFHHCSSALAEGKKEYAKALHLVADCAGFCNLSATLIARRSPLMAQSCAACTAACQVCGAECDKLNTPAMKECALACHRCEEACRAMVKAMGGLHH